MEELTSLLTLLNNLSPLAIIGLLAIIIYKLVWRDKPASEKSVNEIRDNHLHELPEIAETLRRIEQKMGEEFSYIKARLNGRP